LQVATHKAIRTYREALDAYAGQQIKHEGATETAFQRLLSDTARGDGWMLVPKLPIKRGGKSITPDGTVRDANFLHRGTSEVCRGPVTWHEDDAMHGFTQSERPTIQRLMGPICRRRKRRSHHHPVK